jgi:heterodisulfide reductase subunit A
VVDTVKVAEEALKMPGVVFATNYKYMCSDPGQELIRRAIQEHQLKRIVVAACSPRMHENTFRKAVAAGGLNPYLFEMVNIREQNSWVHSDPQKATAKAVDLIRGAVSKALKNKPLEGSTIPITRRVLVIGGGIAGIQASLDMADAGHEVLLVERSATIGGKMTQMDKTFPTLDCSA